jgi:lipopolysaccharide transport system ATP-binding protein
MSSDQLRPSSKGEVAITARGVGKTYRIAQEGLKHGTLGEQVLAWAANPLRRPRIETFHALSDVDFDIRRGEVVGLIGRNGAGKSTLLKLLSRITHPTAGFIELYGRVGSLLEVGTGFHPELTGRENIFLNGAILGMGKSEVRKQFDAIVSFAGVEQFLDTPVKRYSSGMHVRLAFAVAAHLDCEIMLVDEVLAVGDMEFQRKCLGKMQEVAGSGRTVLLVSHNMQSIRSLCTSAMLLQGGKLVHHGDVDSAIEGYLKSYEDPAAKHTPPERRPGTGEYRFDKVWLEKPMVHGSDEKLVHFSINRVGNEVGRMYLSCHIVDDRGAVVLQCDSRLVGHTLDDADDYHGTLKIGQPWLKPGRYRIDMYLCATRGLMDAFEGAAVLQVSPELPYEGLVPEDGIQHGLVFGDFQWHTQSGKADA